jgi:Pvc16 N-terminal domain
VSNQLAIATVTAALRETIQVAIRTDGSINNFTVRTTRPQNPPPQPAGPGLFVYLYQAMPNAAQRGVDLPTRRGDGSLVQRPQMALNLYYLLSYFGDEAALEPQRLLGIVARTLHSQPLISKAMIQRAMAADAFLAQSDLASAVESVRLTPITLNLEDLSKLWSVYVQSPYLLSMAYEASAVLIEDIVTPEPSLPVRTSETYSVLFLQPQIDDVGPASGNPDPVVMGSILRVRGSNLKGTITHVRIGSAEAPPSQVSDAQIGIALGEPPFAAGSLRSGIEVVQVIHYEKIGADQRLLPTAESNLFPLVFRPKIVDPPVFAPGPLLELKVTPAIASNQRISLDLAPIGGGKSRNIPLLSPPNTTSDLSIAINGTPPGQYLVRLRVDEADSPLVVDDNPASPTFQQFIGPKVVVI